MKVLRNHPATVAGDASAGRAELIERFLRRQQQAEDIQIELLVEVLLGHALQRREFLNPGVVDQDIKRAESLLRFHKQAFDVRLLRDVGLHGNGPAAPGSDFANDPIRFLFAGSVPVSLQDLKQQEREFILEALAKTRGKIYGPDGAAALLGVKPTTLSSKVHRMGLKKFEV